MGSPAVCCALRHPVSKGWGIFSAFFPYLPAALPLHGFLRYPLVKGWGIYGNFLPYLPEALPLYGPLRHPTSKGMVFFAIFSPTSGLHQTPAPLSFRLQKFTHRLSSRPFVHNGAGFASRSLATAPRTGMGAFRCKTVLRAPPVQEKGVFCTGRA